MKLLRLLLLYSLPTLIATQYIACKDSIYFSTPSVDGCLALIHKLNQEYWTHLNLIFGRRRSGFAMIPNCQTFQDCQICLLSHPQEWREDQFTWFSYSGSMEATVLKCIAKDRAGGYFPAGPRGIFIFGVHGRQLPPLSASLSNTTAFNDNILRELDLFSS